MKTIIIDILHKIVKENKLAHKLIEKLGPNVYMHSALITDSSRVKTLIKKLHPVIGDKELIRIGPNADGGYLIPDDLEGVGVCFSPGVGGSSSFEKDCTRRGMQVYLADKSVDKPVEDDENFHFTKKFLGAIDDSSFMTLQSWVESSVDASDEDLMLQMDIEGFEYEVILDTPLDTLKRFRVMAIEFHYLDHMWSEPYFNIVSRAFDKLLQTHICVHNHPNNYCGLVEKNGVEIPRVTEMTFIRRDRLLSHRNVTQFPHELDFDNKDQCATMPLPKSWHA